LDKNEKDFYSEIVFILQTYFFVYVGLSIKFDNLLLYLLGLLIIAMIILVRPVPIRMLGKKSLKMRDVSIMSILTPKGLVTAVLASIPLQMGLPYAEDIQSLGYAIVFLSITVSSMLVIIADKNPFFMERYNFINLRLREMKQKEDEETEQKRLLEEQEELEKQEAKAIATENTGAEEANGENQAKADEDEENDDSDQNQEKPKDKGYNEFEEE
jgi:NhaP-type Na+/H+ or K+/H+ antiporter